MLTFPKTILLVSDIQPMRFDLERALIAAGLEIAGTAASVTDALFQILERDIDGALLDVAVDGESTYPILDVLAFATVPFVIATACPRSTIPSRHDRRPFIAWPCGQDQIASVLAGVFGEQTVPARGQTAASWPASAP